MHAICVVCSIPRYRAEISKQLRAIIDSELAIVDDCAQAAGWVAHTARILKCTLDREYQYVRADRDSSADGGHRTMAKCIESLLAAFNGDIRGERVQHVCRDGCCQSRQDTIDKLAGAYEAAILSILSTQTPSKNRWGSCAKALGIQNAGHCLHNLLNRALRAAFPKYHAIDAIDNRAENREDAQGVDQDYKRLLRNKSWRATHTCTTPAERLQSAKLTFITHEMDHLWLKLQHMDANGHSLVDICYPPTNPFLQTQSMIGQTLREPPRTGRLGPLFHQFVDAGDLEGELALIGAVRIEMMSMSAQVYHWLESEYQTWPYSLLQMIDPRHGRSRLEVATSFFQEYPCNLDVWFSTRLRALFQTPAELASCTTLIRCLRLWGHSGKACNMHVERAFARMRKGTVGKAPQADRVLMAGCLAEWLRRHSQEWGGHDPRKTTMEQLSKAGAPLQCNERRRRENSSVGGVSPAFAYGHKKVWEEADAAAAHGRRLSKRERNDRMSHFSKEFTTLSDQDKAEWIEVARNARDAKRGRVADRAEAQELAGTTDWSRLGLGISDQDWPLKIDVAMQNALSLTGTPPGSSFPGAAACWRAAQTYLHSKSIVFDEGAWEVGKG